MEISIPWIIALVVVLITFLILRYRKRAQEYQKQLEELIEEENKEEERLTEKSFRESLKREAANLDDEVHTDSYLEATLGYNPMDNETIDHFRPIKKKTNCLFARSAKVWGSKIWDDQLSLEDNVTNSLASLALFMKLAKGLHLDGFVFEIPGRDFNRNVHTFGDAVRRICFTINPHAMTRSYIDKKGWYFEIGKESIFLTTFSSCYNSNSSRYTYGVNSGFLLLQPEFSFAWKDIGFDTATTNWDDPQTMRDKIRVEFKKNGQEYEIPNTIHYPASHHVVKPMNLGDPVVEWWKQ